MFQIGSSMLLFKKYSVFLKSFIALAFLSLALSACSFSPIYGDKAFDNSNIRLSYSEPKTRLEQIIYSDLRLKLGEEANSDLLTIAVSSSTRSIARTGNGLPSSISEAIVTARIKIVDFNDETNIIFSGTRSAATSYSTNGQIIADKKALEDAQERAALELAQIIRLTLIGSPTKTNDNSQ